MAKVKVTKESPTGRNENSVKNKYLQTSIIILSIAFKKLKT